MQSAIGGLQIRPDDCGTTPRAPQLEEWPGAPGAPKRELAAYIAPEQLGYVAAAQLQLPEPGLGFEPDPEWNRWKKAFVNVEYWVWLQGPSELPVASQSVGPASVRLTARLEQLSISDSLNGAKDCTGVGSRRAEETSLFKPSPTCGVRFDEKGQVRLSLIARWAVKWEINGVVGVARFDRVTSRSFEVGELHSVTR